MFAGDQKRCRAADCPECSEALRRSAYRQRLMLIHIQSLEQHRELQEKVHQSVVAGLKKHIFDLERTFSWRVTAPIRWLRHWLRNR